MMNKKMPAIFLAHGSPASAIQESVFSKSLGELGSLLPRPSAILMISAHWETDGTWVTGMESPKTIHDFSGFSKELQEFQYPAPGEPILAKKISSIETFKAINIELEKWGLDHGTWSVLTHLFPEADIPVLQLSLDQTAPMKSHFELGEKIKFLRSEGVMIIGSGNIVHNLRQANWTPEAKPSAEAAEFDEWVMEKINERDFNSLIHKPLESRAGQFSNPTIEHYLPLLYILGASDSEDKIHVDYKGIENSSVSMRCIRFT